VSLRKARTLGECHQALQYPVAATLTRRRLGARGGQPPAGGLLLL